MYALGCGSGSCAQPCSQCAQRNTCASSTAPDAPAPSSNVLGYVLALVAGLFLAGGK